MTNIYCAQVTAAFTANTDQLAIEITAAANTILKIRKIRIMHGQGDEADISDYYKRVKLVLESAAGTGGATFTPMDLNANAPAANATVKTGAFTPGTISTTLDVLSLHSTTDFYWSAAGEDDDDKIVVPPGGIFGVIINAAN